MSVGNDGDVLAAGGLEAKGDSGREAGLLPAGDGVDAGVVGGVVGVVGVELAGGTLAGGWVALVAGVVAPAGGGVVEATGGVSLPPPKT